MNLSKYFSILGTFLLLVLTHHSAFGAEYTYDQLNRLTRVVYDNGDSISYQYDGAGNITATSVVDTAVDTDQDGIPDSWEQQYFPGTAGLVILSPGGDYDHDGYSDYQEYLNGTNPTVQDPPGGPGYDASLITFQLTVTFAGNGTGTVNLTPPDGICTTDCAQDYLYGNQVTLTATPDEGYYFKGWNGAGCSGTGVCTITIEEDTNVEAVFDTRPPFNWNLFLPAIIQGHH